MENRCYIDVGNGASVYFRREVIEGASPRYGSIILRGYFKDDAKREQPFPILLHDANAGQQGMYNLDVKNMTIVMESETKLKIVTVQDSEGNLTYPEIEKIYD